MARKFSSVAVETTLSFTISSSATSMTVGSVTGWPTSPSVSAPYSVILDPDTASEEVVEVTGAAGTVLTIVRGVDGTTAKAHNAGAVAKHGVSARDFSEPAAHIDNTTTAHGVSGAVVGTTSTQTLTNKTIDASSNTISNIANANVAAAANIAASKIAGTAVTQADSGTVTSAMIANGTIVDADINASAAIAASKIAGTAVTQSDSATVTNTMLAGSIANAKLANSAVTIGSTSVSLGATAATVSGLTLTSPTINGATLNTASTIGGVSGTTIATWAGAWTSYTPVVSGFSGTVTATASGSYHYANEKTIVARVSVTFSAFATPGTGTITVSLPLTSVSAGYTSGVSVIGSGLCDLAGSGAPNPYLAVPTWNSTTTFSVLFNNPSTSITTRWTGDQPSGQASTDRWSFLICYEIA